MKTTLTITVCLLLAASQAWAAQADKKGGKAAAPKKAAAVEEGDKTTASEEPEGDSEETGEGEVESPLDENEPADPKSSKKSGGKNSTELDESSEAELIAKNSYMQGYAVGKHFHERGVDLNEALFIKGLRAAIAGKDPQMTPEEMATWRMALEKLMVERLGAKNKAEGEKFLAKNKKREGVKTLKSGLQYEVLKSGKGGKSPKKTDTVTTNYEGKLLDDQVFDSSYARRQPTSFRVDQVIPAWTEALQLMKVGDKWRLFVPADLAYGDKGIQDPTGREVIPPASTLVFDVELLGINERGQRAIGE